MSVVEDVEEGLVVTQRELDRFTYAVRFGVPERIRELAEDAYVRVLGVDALSTVEAFGEQVRSIAVQLLIDATAGWTTDERHNERRSFL